MPPIARSYLFVPGSRPDRFDKALASGAHAVIVDLEDAVGPGEKNSARDAVAGWLDPSRPVVLRVNGVSTAWFHDDLKLCGMPGVCAVMLPKTESPDELRLVADRTRGPLPLLPLVESARGFDRSGDIALVPAVQRLVFGNLDFQLDLGLGGDEDETLYFRSRLTLVSRLSGLQPPVDGVWTGIDDHEELRARTLRARRLGFGAKLCIHPAQVAHVNRCFQPTDGEIAWAKRVLDATSRGAVARVDGQMVDRPVMLKAQQILNDVPREASS